MSAASDLLVADGRVDEYLLQAQKSIQSGSFEKSIAYGLLALAWQHERSRAEKNVQEEYRD